MRLTTIPVHHVDEQILDALLEAGVAVAPADGELIVESKFADRTVRLLQIHGYEPSKPRMLEQALTTVASKYQLDEFIRFESEQEEAPKKKPEDLVGRKRIINFIQRKMRETRKLRNRKRKQHVRDELTGKVRAYEEILRRVKSAR